MRTFLLQTSILERLAGPLCLAVLGAPPALTAPAGLDLVVNDPGDAPDSVPGNSLCETATNVCTLRAAIQEANAHWPIPDTIHLPAGTYTLTQVGVDNSAALGDLDILDNLTLLGAGAKSTFVDGNGGVTGDRVFEIFGGITVMISGVTIEYDQGSDGGGLKVGDGGQLVLMDSTVGSDYASGFGGGIFGQGSIRIVNSTISWNGASSGGGIETGGDLTIINSTISDNLAQNAGGGIMVSGLGSVAQFFNTTIANNRANAGLLGGSGGGVRVENSRSLSLHDSILAWNRTTVSHTLPVDDCSNAPTAAIVATSSDIILTVDAAHCTITGSYSNADPLLGPLQDNGGPTSTLALLPGSPAIDTGTVGGCNDDTGAALDTDQRGYPRPANGAGVIRCDVGAYEVQRVVYLPLALR